MKRWWGGGDEWGWGEIEVGYVESVWRLQWWCRERTFWRVSRWLKNNRTNTARAGGGPGNKSFNWFSTPFKFATEMRTPPPRVGWRSVRRWNKKLPNRRPVTKSTESPITGYGASAVSNTKIKIDLDPINLMPRGIQCTCKSKEP